MFKVIQRFQKTPNEYIFTLKMETAMSIETLDNSQFCAPHIRKPKLYSELTSEMKYKKGYEVGIRDYYCTEIMETVRW
jgi:hypothetical protein